MIDEYQKILEKYKIQHFKDQLKKTIKLAEEEFKYLNITNPREIKNLKKEWTKNL